MVWLFYVFIVHLSKYAFEKNKILKDQVKLYLKFLYNLIIKTDQTLKSLKKAFFEKYKTLNYGFKVLNKIVWLSLSFIKKVKYVIWYYFTLHKTTIYIVFNNIK